MQIVAWLFLVLQALIVIASLLGYGIFTSRPELLAQVDPQARFFTWAFHGFAVGNMLFGGLAVVADALRHNRMAAFVAFVAVYLVSLASELMGTGLGVPFGPYSYTSLLGPKWFELVPLLIPLSWFTMTWACWVIARRRVSGLPAILLGTALLVAWDLLLDPAMSKVTSYWVWGEAGSYYGMPWSNLFGWGVTGLVLFIILDRMTPAPQSSLRFALWVYAVNFLLPLGFCVLNQYWIAVTAGLGTMLVAWLIAGRFGSTDPEPSYSAKGATLEKLSAGTPSISRHQV
ncbi:MAG TPA: carotenoid biosynthesis protein [Candidatus Binatia bacterium]|nr:carotenoid biosynthesis protein [Candidatus Binatia bacterium]